MTIYNFNQFALSRDEIKKIVGGFDDSSGKKCSGSCTIRRTDGSIAPGECNSEKPQGSKTKACICNGKSISSTCAYT
jgi:hypothetical protein